MILTGWGQSQPMEISWSNSSYFLKALGPLKEKPHNQPNSLTAISHVSCWKPLSPNSCQTVHLISSVRATSRAAFWECDGKKGTRIQWVVGLARISTGKAILWRGPGHSVSRRTLKNWMKSCCAHPLPENIRVTSGPHFQTMAGNRKHPKWDNKSFHRHLWEPRMPHLECLFHLTQPKGDNTSTVKMLRQMSVGHVVLAPGLLLG